MIDRHKPVSEDFYYHPDQRYYPELDRAMDDPDTVYQWRRVYVRKNQSRLCPTLTANMGTGGHNVPIIRDYHGIRKLTPEECLTLQGFPPSFRFPKNMARSHMYKQVGNSVTVPVVKMIADNMIYALDRWNDEGI